MTTENQSSDKPETAEKTDGVGEVAWWYAWVSESNERMAIATAATMYVVDFAVEEIGMGEVPWVKLDVEDQQLRVETVVGMWGDPAGAIRMFSEDLTPGDAGKMAFVLFVAAVTTLEVAKKWEGGQGPEARRVSAGFRQEWLRGMREEHVQVAASISLVIERVAEMARATLNAKTGGKVN